VSGWLERAACAACLSYFFLVITSWQDYIPTPVTIDTLALAGTYFLGILHWLEFGSQRNLNNLRFGSCLWLGLIVCVPLVSGIVNESLETVFTNGSWRSLIKMLLAAPWLLYWASQRKSLVLSTFFAGHLCFTLEVLFRFYVLKENHEATGRLAPQMSHGDANFIAATMAFFLPLVIFKINQSISKIRTGRIANKSAGFVITFEWKHLFHTVLWAAYVVLIIWVSLLSQSRVGVFSVALVGLATIFFAPLVVARTKLLLPVVVLFGLFMAVAGEGVLERFSSLDDASNQGRIESIQTGYEMLAANPVFGLGLGSGSEHYQSHELFESLARNLDIHNTPFQVLGELGLLGFFAYGMFFMYVLGVVVNSWHRYLLPAFAGFALISLLINSLSLPLAYNNLVFGLAIFLVALNQFEQEGEVSTIRGDR
jgi:O-antigen ligase